MTREEWESSKDARELLRHAVKVLPRPLVVLGVVAVAETVQHTAHPSVKDSSRAALNATLAWSRGEVSAREVGRAATEAFADASKPKVNYTRFDAYVAADAASVVSASEHNAVVYASHVADGAAKAFDNASPHHGGACKETLEYLAKLVRDRLPFSAERSFHTIDEPSFGEVSWSDDEWVFFRKASHFVRWNRYGLDGLRADEEKSWSWILTNKPEGDK